MSAWAFLFLCALVLAAPHIRPQAAWIVSAACAGWAFVLAVIDAVVAALG